MAQLEKVLDFQESNENDILGLIFAFFNETKGQLMLPQALK